MIKRTGLLFLLGLILMVCSCAPVTIETIPAGATIYNADGTEQLGATPYKTHMFIRDKKYVVRKERFYDEPVDLYFDSPEVLGVRLRPMPVTLYTVPDTDVYAANTETPIARTPTKMEVYGKDRTYTLKADGFYDKDVTIGPESTDPVIVELDRRPIVTIAAQPAGVAVYEGDQLIGSAPVKQEILTERTFELRKEGYFSKSITLKGAPPYEVSTELEAYPVITVKAQPAGAKIYSGNKLLGTESASLSVGEAVQLEVRADRFYKQEITLTPKSDKTVSVSLEPMPYVTLSSDPSGATVSADGKTLGTTPLELLVETPASYTLSKDGYQAATLAVTGKDSTATATLQKTAESSAVASSAPAQDAMEQAPVAEKTEKKSFWQKLFGK